MRTADDLIARAEADNRGVAIIPLSEVGRDISLETPGAARVRLRAAAAEAACGRAQRRAAAAFQRFVTATPNIEVVWLSDGVDVADGRRLRRSASPASCRASAVTVVDAAASRRPARSSAPTTRPVRSP